MKELLFKVVLILMLSGVSATGTTLTGKMLSPTGVGFANGSLAMTGPTGVTLTQACGGQGGQTYTVPQFTTQVVNGVLTTNSLIGNDCMVPGGTAYQAVFTDSATSVRYSAQWYVFGVTMDVGTFVVGGAGNVVQSPTGTQNVAQKPGTYLLVNNLQTTAHMLHPYGMGPPAAPCVQGDDYLQVDAAVQQWQWLCPNGTWQNMTGSGGTVTPPSISHTISFTVNQVGQLFVGQLGSQGCTITGWSLGTSDSSGGIATINLDAHANAPPPATPWIPVQADVISGSAATAMKLTAGQASASGGAAAISTWAKTRAAWDTFTVDVTAITLSYVSGTVFCE